MSKILRTGQDYEAAKDKNKFLLQAIKEYQSSEGYLFAKTAQNYFAGKNEAINKRMSYLERSRRHKSNVIFNKLSNKFFNKGVMYISNYLLGNGVTIDEADKSKLGKKFDKKLLLMGIYALVDGVCWGFWDVEEGLVPFRIAEVDTNNGFFALPDERTNTPMIGVRFWQIDSSKPMYIALYERDGVTEYKVDDKMEMTEFIPKKPYKTITGRDTMGEQIVGIENHNVLPIFPLYPGITKQSELTGIKGWVDAYDFVASDLIDGITLVDGLYSIVKNYGGDDLEQLVTEIQNIKIIYSDGNNAGADMEVVESPFQSKMESLQFLEKCINTFMMIPISQSGRAVTATEINVSREPTDFKADLFEMHCIDFVENILRLNGIDGKEPKFKRRTTTNDTEIVNAISVMRSDLSLETTLKLNPMIPDDMIEQNIRELEAEHLALTPDSNSANENEGEPSEDSEV